MSVLGPIPVVGNPDYTSRIGTLSAYDFAYWASTYITDGEPSDYLEPGPETSGAPLIAWAASQVGVAFPADFDEALVALADSHTSVESALRVRGALLINSASSIGICMGMRDIMMVTSGRYYLFKNTDVSTSQWLYGARIPGMVY
jgi:hypothetical protein